MGEKTTNLNEILKIVDDNNAQKLRTLAVFDLDSTLFNVSPRTQQILYEFADLHNLPELKKVRVELEDWGIKEAMIRAGYQPTPEEPIFLQLRDFWKDRFFSNEYLHYDVPYKGAIHFVLQLLERKCEIQYLTGRDVFRLGRGSVEVLKKWGFPCDEGQLHLKPHREMDDRQFKTDWFLRDELKQYSKILFFENEPVNINSILKAAPQVEIIFVDTTHSRQEQVLDPRHRIKHFEYEL